MIRLLALRVFVAVHRLPPHSYLRGFVRHEDTEDTAYNNKQRRKMALFASSSHGRNWLLAGDMGGGSGGIGSGNNNGSMTGKSSSSSSGRSGDGDSMDVAESKSEDAGDSVICILMSKD
jgi:hypothetical protein